MRSPAYAKVNLTLDIVSRRPDGFHDIKTVMRSVSLCDYIELSVSEADGFAVSGMPAPEDKSNLCIRARDAFREYTGINTSVAISLDKRIPFQAGLGGGSSDAAAVLCLINRVLDAGLTDAELEKIAGTLGSDVAFFIRGGTALCTGRGEKISHLDARAPELYLVIAKGESGLSTPAMYKSFDATGDFDIDGGRSEIILAATDADCIADNVYNSFDTVASSVCPDITEIKAAMLACGAKCALLSGSGSAVFGIYPDKQAADSAALMLKAKGYFAQSCIAL